MLKRIIDSLDGLDDALKPLYKQTDGGRFALQVDDAAELKVALDREREHSKDLEKRLKSTGIDLEEYSRLKEAAAQREAEEARKGGEWDKLQKLLVSKHKEEMAKLGAELESMRQGRLSSFADSEIATAIAQAKGNHALLEPAISRQVKAVERDGKLCLSVIGKDGAARVKDGAGTPFTLADLVSEMKANEDFGGAFLGSGSTGSGTHPASGPGGTVSNARAQFDALKAKGDLTAAESLAMVALGGQLKAAAQNQPA